MPRALLSVSDKSGLTGFARGLERLGFELYATGNTLKAIQDAAIDALPVTMRHSRQWRGLRALERAPMHLVAPF